MCHSNDGDAVTLVAGVRINVSAERGAWRAMDDAIRSFGRSGSPCTTTR